MDRLFLDANVLFTAAHNPQGKAAFLFGELPPAPWELLSSAFAVEEARRNLIAKYPHCLPAFEELIQALVMVPQPAPRGLALDLPEKDAPIFLAAHAGKATHLLTGDLKHFGPYMNDPLRTEGIVIQTVGEYLSALLTGG